MSLKTFEAVKDFLTDITDIHCGECAIAALAMKRWLKTYENIESDIVYGFRDKEYYGPNSRALNENNTDHVSSCSHAGIRIQGDDYILDAEEI